MTNEDIARRVNEARFIPVRMRAGYDMAAVDDFLDEVVAASDDPAVIRSLVDGAQFAIVRMREGYWPEQVDEFLASLVDGAPTDHAVRPEAPEPTPSYTGAIQETRSWWSRTFGPK